MSGFDAISHSFATVAIGGFSTHDSSIGYFNSEIINYITVFFLLISSCNFALHFAFFDQFHGRYKGQARNRFLRLYWRDYEFRFFILVQISLFLICFFVLWAYSYFDNNQTTLSQALFQSVSISTTAGFTTNDFSSWPSFLPLLLVLASFIGGCARDQAMVALAEGEHLVVCHMASRIRHRGIVLAVGDVRYHALIIVLDT